MFGRQKRQVPTPTPIGPHQSANPMFPHTDWTAFRQQVYRWTGVMLGLVLIGWLIYGPWFAIRDVEVVGTRLITPNSVQRVADQYLHRQRWFILPNRTLWTLSAPGLTSYLQKQIQQRISVEKVVVEKHSPHKIRIVINERTPMANWTDGHTYGTIDRQGKIIELHPVAVEHLPTIRDENAQSFRVDSSVVKQEVISSLLTLAGYMQQAHVEVTEYLIPVPTCPTEIQSPAGASTNGIGSNRNVNAVVTNTQTNTTANTNISVVTITPPCDVTALRYASQEIHVQLKDGPRVLFDRHEDLAQAVQALQRVITERSGPPYTSVDVRFGERVYVK